MKIPPIGRADAGLDMRTYECGDDRPETRRPTATISGIRAEWMIRRCALANARIAVVADAWARRAPALFKEDGG